MTDKNMTQKKKT